ncbi:MAG: F-type H+-transporting ATPase subunit delta, partial [bacterium]
STSELDLNTKEILREKLERILGNKQKVTIEATVDPNLIGGIVVRLNDLIYDGSIKGRLENLKRRLG